MDKRDLEVIILNSIKELITNDEYLFHNDVHEQTITSRLAFYIAPKILPIVNGGWNVYVEYNRNGKIPKRLHSIGNVKPDIIIHKRSLNNDNGTENNNLLIIEVKKNPTQTDIEIDTNKIVAFIEEGPFYYCYGLFIGFNTNDLSYSLIWHERNERSI